MEQFLNFIFPWVLCLLPLNALFHPECGFFRPTVGLGRNYLLKWVSAGADFHRMVFQK